MNFSADKNIVEKKLKADELLASYRSKPLAAKGKLEYGELSSFSFSQIRSYRVCPYQYKLAHVIKFQPKGSASLSFGSTIHNVLLRFYSRVQEMNSTSQGSLFALPIEKNPITQGVKTPSLDDLLKIYDECWIGDWYQNKAQRESYYRKGKELLREFFQTNDGQWSVPVALEGGFKIKIKDFVLGGRIDRVDKMNDGRLEIIDYKTGASRDKLASEDREQLLIYQLAAEALPEYRNVGAPGALTFYYLDDGTKQSFLGEAKELEKLQEKIIGIVEKIRAGEFNATPEKFACARCDFRDICDFRV